MQLVNTTVHPFMLSAPNGKRNSLIPPMAHSTMEAYEFVCRQDQTGKIADSHNDKKQKAATTLFRLFVCLGVRVYGVSVFCLSV